MAIPASEARTGDVIRLNGALQKIQSANLHTGGGKTGSMVHVKLLHLETGHVTENRLAPTDKLDKVDIERVPMEYLYNEGEDMIFMHPTTFEQCRLSKNAVGKASELLKEGDTIHVELLDDKPIALNLPEFVELKVTNTGAGVRGEVSSTYKEAELENGVKVMVPQFIKEGDKVRVNMETREYMDRVHEKHEKAVFKAAPKKGGGKEAPKTAPGATPAAPPPAAKPEDKK